MRIFAIVLLAGAAAIAAAAPLRADGLDRITAATVAIRCRAGETPGGFIGTGVVVNKLGYILTSTTVVPPKAFDIRCSFLGPRVLPARLIVADEKLELAVIKVDPPDDMNLAAIALGSSKQAKVGQTVFTVGDGYSTFARSGQFTVSLGIVSGIYDLTRQIAPQPVYVGPALETTATVAPGMDGGPLLDVSGRMIGMLSLNVSDARWMGVAVPIDALVTPMAKVIAEDAIKHGHKAEEVAMSTDTGVRASIFPAQERQDKAFMQSADQIARSVVAIEVDRKSERRATTQSSGPRPPQPRPPRPRADAAAYSGFFVRPKTPVSGVIVGGDGHILTSYYNVWGELNSIHVVLPDGRRLPARLLGFDETEDLAVLKVEAKDLTPVKLTADKPLLSTQVATVGRSPDPESITMTRGIVSAVGWAVGTRMGMGDRPSGGLQIDAETNYANAGAPVIDIHGNCLGIVTQVRPDTIWGQNSGIGFATTADIIRRDLPSLMAGKIVEKPRRGFLGIVMSQGRLDVNGVVVDRVQDDGPADQAGIQAKDVITHINGRAVADQADVANLVLGRKPGEVVQLTVQRGKQTLKIDVTLGEHPVQ